MGQDSSGGMGIENSAPQHRAVNLATPTEDVALGLMSPFDGPADDNNPFLQQPATWNGLYNMPMPNDHATAQYGQYDGGRWVWQQRQTPFEDIPWQHQYHYPLAQDRTQQQEPRRCSPPFLPRSTSSSQYPRRASHTRPDKQVRFDFGESPMTGTSNHQYHPRPMSAVRERPAPRRLSPSYNVYTHRGTHASPYEPQQIPSPRHRRAPPQASQTSSYPQTDSQSGQASRPQADVPTESRGGPPYMADTVNNTQIPHPDPTQSNLFYMHQPQVSQSLYHGQTPQYAALSNNQSHYVLPSPLTQQATPFFFAAAGAPSYRPGYSHPIYSQPPTQLPEAYGQWPLPTVHGPPHWYMQPPLQTYHPSSAPVSPAVSPKTQTVPPTNVNAQNTDSTPDTGDNNAALTNDSGRADSWNVVDSNNTDQDTNVQNANNEGGSSALGDDWGNSAAAGDSWQQGDTTNNTSGGNWESTDNAAVNSDSWNAPNNVSSSGNETWQSTKTSQPTQKSTNGPQAKLAAIGRDLYGPFGPYYSTRTAYVDDLKPDVEEEPRYDVPLKFAHAYGSTKQVQPGPGYRYYKKSHKPRYLDDLSQPYARFVFKYRTKEQITKEIGVKVNVEPSSNQEIRQLQDFSKEDLIQMLLRAKSGLGGKIPSPPETPPNRDDGLVQPRFVNRPDVSFLRYESLIPQPRPPVTQVENVPGAQQWNAGGWDGAKPEATEPASQEPQSQSSPKDWKAWISAEEEKAQPRDWNDITNLLEQNQQTNAAAQESEQTISMPWTDPPPPPPPPADTSQPVGTDWEADAWSGAGADASGGW